MRVLTGSESINWLDDFITRWSNPYNNDENFAQLTKEYDQFLDENEFTKKAPDQLRSELLELQLSMNCQPKFDGAPLWPLAVMTALALIFIGFAI